MKKPRRTDAKSHTESCDAAYPLTPDEEALLCNISGASCDDKPLPPPVVLPNQPLENTENTDTEEDALLRALLHEAYPNPRVDLHASVMKKIRLARQRKKRAVYVRWGSAAACLCLLCSVTFAAAPLFRKTVAMNATTAEDNAVENTANEGNHTSDLSDVWDETGLSASSADLEETGAQAVPETEISAWKDSENLEITEDVSATAEDPAEMLLQSSVAIRSQAQSVTDYRTNTAANSSNDSTMAGSNGVTGNTDTQKNQPSSTVGNSNNLSHAETATNSGASTEVSTKDSSANTAQNSTSSGTGGSTGRTHPEVGSPVYSNDMYSNSGVTSWKDLPIIRSNPAQNSSNQSSTSSSSSHSSGTSSNASEKQKESTESSAANSSTNSESDDTQAATTYSATFGALPMPTVMSNDSGTVANESDVVEAEATRNTLTPEQIAQNQVKWALTQALPIDQYTAWMTEMGYSSAAEFSLAELIRGMDVPFDTFRTVVQSLGLENSINEGLYYPPEKAAR